MVRLKGTILALLLVLAGTSRPIQVGRSGDASTFTITEQSRYSTTIVIAVNTVHVNDVAFREGSWRSITIDGFGQLRKPGSPSLPVRALNVIAGKNRGVSYTVQREAPVILRNIRVYPSPGAVHAYTDMHKAFLINRRVYAADADYPLSNVSTGETVVYKGIPITRVHIAPVLFNPARKQLKIFTRLTVKINHSQVSQRQLHQLTKNAVTFLKNIVVNPQALPEKSANPIEDFEDDVLILTKDDYKEAAETLAEWQRMKGYDVHIETKSSWDSLTMKSTAHDFYNKATVKPGYLLLLGCFNDLPAPIGNYINFKPYPMDVYYATMDGQGDYIPEMARGRVSVTSASQAMDVVEKIIRFEKEPPQSADYFSTVLASAYFQTNAGLNGYEEFGFARTVEHVTIHLDSIGYNVERAYHTEADKNPTNWNNTVFGFGEAIPSYLKKPAFPWDADENTIASIINHGCFLVYHYDHGFLDGWANPNFRTGNMKSLLSNGEKLPIIYSMDCLAGRYNEAEQCFAEEILQKENGGAAGIIAASCLSYTGNNDAFLHGLIDATWPGTVLKVPQFPDPDVISHEPVYIMGDIMDQGLFRMGEIWPDSAVNENGFQWTGMTKFHYDIYHYHGDPTTRIWTGEPKTVSVQHSGSIPSNAKNFSLSGMNITSGVATLLDNKTGTIVGKKEIAGGSASIQVVNPITSNGTVTLTITGQNVRPYITELSVGPTAIDKDNTIGVDNLIRFKNSTLYLSCNTAGSIKVMISDLRGREMAVFQRQLRTNTGNTIPISLEPFHFGTGMYLLTIENNGTKNIHKIYIRK